MLVAYLKKYFIPQVTSSEETELHHCTMAKKSRILKSLLFLLALAVILWQLEIKMVLTELIGVKNISRETIRRKENISVDTSGLQKENASHSSGNQMKHWLIIFWSTYFGQKRNEQFT